MSITSAICNEYKKAALPSTHTYKIALYTSSATLNKNTTAYTTSGEVSGLNYIAGGQILVGFSVSLISDTAVFDWTIDPKWEHSTITARGALIYDNSLVGKTAVCVLDFGSDKKSIHDDFTVEFPSPGTGPGGVEGLVRLA